MRKTHLHPQHESLGGQLVDFAGWSMPIQYSTIVEEHHAVRQGCGLFDIGHMGRILFHGPQAAKLLDTIVTIDVTKLSVGRVRYALICNGDGGIMDDVLVYRLGDAEHMLVVNASNTAKILEWISNQPGDVPPHTIQDGTAGSLMLALQGPQAGEVVEKLLPNQGVNELKYYRCGFYDLDGKPALISRTGYTGEDGFEITVVDPSNAGELWERMLQAKPDVTPCGLGCRDTLRLEAGMPLYGHELSEEIDPFTAGLGFAVQFSEQEFVGRPALEELAARNDLRRRIGLELETRRIARDGSGVLRDGESVGRVTSGTFSPTLQKSIAMTYVESNVAEATTFDVEIRGKTVPAKQVELPFYRRKKA